MPRRRRHRRFPSYRNLQIYHDLAYERRTQMAVAAEFGLSQRRVSQIGQQVLAWVDRLVAPRHFLGQPGLRFHLALAQERLRLHETYDPLLQMFLGDDGQPRYLKRYVTVVNGEPLNTVEISERHDFRLLDQAADIQGRLVELEAVANRGPFADVLSQVHQTIIHRHGAGHESDGDSALNAAAGAVLDASNPRRSSATNPSNPCENRGRGILNGPQPQAGACAEHLAPPEFAAAAPPAAGGQKGGTKSC
jgi:hypothetical protein